MQGVVRRCKSLGLALQKGQEDKTYLLEPSKGLQGRNGMGITDDWETFGARQL